VNVPAVVLHALRDAVLAGPDGEQRLRDAGFVAGLALYDAFSATVQASDGVAPTALSFARFADALGRHLADHGWGTVHIAPGPTPDVVHVDASRWVESDAEGESPFPACHFSTGLFAGLFGRAAGAPLAVLEVSCRAAGAATCTFAVGSREVMDAMWETMR
jgi:predicted hydrocarbon binding protein